MPDYFIWKTPHKVKSRRERWLPIGIERHHVGLAIVACAGGVGLTCLLASFGDPFALRGGDLRAFITLAVAGTLAIIYGSAVLIGFWQARRMRVRRDESEPFHPNEPWRYDLSWDERGIDDDGWQHFRSATLVAIFAIPLLVVFDVVASAVLLTIFAATGVLVLGLVFLLVLIHLVALVAITEGVGRLFARWKYGHSRLELSRFPVHLGQPFRATLLPGRGFASLRRIEVTISCIRDPRRFYGGLLRADAAICVWTARYEVDVDGRTLESAIDLEFPLPDDLRFSTDLRAAPCTYWELKINSDDNGLRYFATFLLPVYAAPPAS